MQAKDIFTYDYIFKSIDDSLDGINEIFISPDGVYNEISLLSLYNPKNNSSCLHRGRFLMRALAVRSDRAFAAVLVAPAVRLAWGGEAR